MTTPNGGAPTRRQLYEAKLKRRALLIAGGSSLAVFAAIVLLVPMAPGWAKVKKSFFNWDVFTKTFPKLLDAFLIDIAIFAWCAPLIAIVGLLVALARDVRSPALFPLRIIGAAYTDIFRGVPVILTVYLIGFGIPGLGLPRPYNSPYIWGSLALILTYSAYVAEIFRSGIDSVHKSQRAASESLGLSDRDTMWFVILPQAIRHVIPAQMNMFIALQKDVALLSFIGPVEIFRQAGVQKSLLANFHPLRRGRTDFSCDHRACNALRRLFNEQTKQGAQLMAMLSLQNVVKRFGDNTVCDGIDLDVEEGQMVCLIGASGAGKSTLLRCINLLEPIEDGAIYLGGEDISIPGLDPQPVRKRIGIVFQSYNLFPHMTALENAMLAPAPSIRSKPRGPAPTDRRAV